MRAPISATIIAILADRFDGMAGEAPNSDFIDAVRASADRLGISPNDLLTAMSYETGGKLSPSLYGGAGGKYLGLIQFGPEEQAKYGVRPDQTAAEQVGSAESFLRDRGLKPGMGLLDVYSTINAGRPGLYNRSDANNGGAPGTVADKVATMAGHRLRANALLGGEAPPVQTAAAAQTAPALTTSGAPLSLAPGGLPEGATPEMLAAMAAIPKMAEESNAIQAPPLTINFPMSPAQARAKAMARAAARSLTA